MSCVVGLNKLLPDLNFAKCELWPGDLQSNGHNGHPADGDPANGGRVDGGAGNNLGITAPGSAGQNLSCMCGIACSLRSLT